MKRKDILAGAIAAVLLGALAFVWFAPGAGAQRAPDVEMVTLDGEELRLSELRGRPVLLTFWATTCPGCLAEMPHLIELHHELAAQGLAIIGVAMSYDPPEQVANLVERRQVPYHIALDSDGEVAKAFGDVRLTPTTFLISPEGRIVRQKIGEMDMHEVRPRIEQWLAART